jgi:predicted dehydrogenase
MAETITASELGIPAVPPLPTGRERRIAMIGFGGIARAHAEAYLKAGYKVVAVADPSPGALDAAGKMLGGVAAYADYREMLEKTSDVDAAGLYTQPTLRLPAAEAVFGRGLALLTEKPLAGTLEEGRRMMLLAEQQRCRLAVSQNYRWMPANWYAARIIRAGWIGTPFYASIQIYGHQDRQLKDHAFYSTCTDFLTVQWNTHLVDLLRYWLGKDARRVWAVSRRPAHQHFVSDNFLSSFSDFGGGVTGQVIHHELLAAADSAMPCRIDGTEGTLTFEVYGNELKITSSKLSGPRVLKASPEWKGSLAYSMGDLLLSIEQDRDPEVSAKQNLATLAQTLAEQQAASAGGAWVGL